MAHSDAYASFELALAECTDVPKLLKLQEMALRGKVPLLMQAQTPERLVYLNERPEFMASPTVVDLLVSIGRQGMLLLSTKDRLGLNVPYLSGLLHKSVAEDVIETVRRCNHMFRARGMAGVSFRKQCAPLCDFLSGKLARRLTDDFFLIEFYDVDVGRGDEALLFQTVDAAISAVCWQQ